MERVPVGFWFHFVTLEEKGQGLNNPRIFQKSVEGHRKYVERIHPDFVKIMSDGFFIYPSNVYSPLVASIQELASIESIGENHPWIQQQVEWYKPFEQPSLRTLHHSTISFLRFPT